MPNEDEIKTLMVGIQASLDAIGKQKSTINFTTLITSLVGTTIVGAFIFYISMIKFTSDITHDVDINKEKIKNSVTKEQYNTHVERTNYNYSNIEKELDIVLIRHTKVN